jgi:acetylornithine/N-succinyldiaminopimelate aminotransferase
MGGILANEKCRNVLTAGMHGSTFGGNPVSAAGALAVMDTLDDQFLAQVKDKGQYLRAGIEGLHSPYLGSVVGMGLMLGIEVKGERTNRELVSQMMDNGLLCLTAGPKIRLLPPLVITKEELDKGLKIMAQTLA